ncbi:MAG: hypothetical protein MJ247_06280 [Alphaproteobacteria bacterium]|nr:hypothetical protein [Alphaproteobacteria bacterium]
MKRVLLFLFSLLISFPSYSQTYTNHNGNEYKISQKQLDTLRKIDTEIENLRANGKDTSGLEEMKNNILNNISKTERNLKRNISVKKAVYKGYN